MADNISKTFATLSSTLEALADGTAKHNKEENFPASISEKNLREKKQNLETLR